MSLRVDDVELRATLRNIQRRRLRAVKPSDGVTFGHVEHLLGFGLVEGSEDSSQVAGAYTQLRVTRRGMDILREHKDLPFWRDLNPTKLGVLFTAIGAIAAVVALFIKQ